MTGIAILDRFRDRLDLVGRTLYGARYKRRLAAALGVSHVHIHRWINGRGHLDDIDGKLVSLLDEKIAAAAEVQHLRKSLMRYVTTQRARQRRRLERNRH